MASRRRSWFGRRGFLGASLAAALAPPVARARADTAAEAAARTAWDIIVIGGGTAGLPAAIFAADRGARVLVIEAAPEIGGTLTIAGGEICAAGTKTQARFGITGDHPDLHFDDVMRLSNGLADPAIIRRTVDHAPAMVDWIDDRGWDCRPGHIVDGSSAGRSGYSKRRYYQAEGQGKAISDLFVREVGARVAAGRVTILVNARASALLAADDGAVEGVRVSLGGRRFAFRGRHVLVTTGGYAMNPDMFMKLVRVPAYVNDSYPYSLGDGLTMAAEIGAALRGTNLHRPGSGSILSGDRWPAQVYARFETRPQVRPPWEIHVNDRGARFVNEELPDRSAREQALLGQPRLRFAVVFDDAVLNAAPPGITDWPREKIAAHFNTHPMFHMSDTWQDLAIRAQIDPAGLAASVAGFNAGIGTGADPFGRQHHPLPLAQPPFYAVVHYGDSATSSVGISVNAELQALRADGSPIANLYAAGEALGSGALLGNAFVPGMMITPSMTLGRWLGLTLPLET